MIPLCVIECCMSLICVVLHLLCDVVCLFMCLCYGVGLSSAYRVHWLVLCVLLCYFLVFLFLVCVLIVVCCDAVCCFVVCRACMCCCCCCFGSFFVF